MRNRLLGMAVALCAVLGIASNALAQNPTPQPRWFWENLMFRNAAPVNTVASGFLADSVSASGSGARSDTTTAIDLLLLPPFMPMNPGSSSSESLLVAAFRLEPDPNSTVTFDADSIYLNVQFSPDGTAWSTATPVGIAFQAANTVNATEIGAFVLEEGSTRTSPWFTRWFKQLYSGGALGLPSLAGTQNDNQWWGQKYARFIVGWGSTHPSGVFRAAFGHWSLQGTY